MKTVPTDHQLVLRLLREQPGICAAWTAEEAGPDGRAYLVAYVVADEVVAESAKGVGGDRDRRLAQWRMAFDQNYRAGPEDNAPSFVGWNSSYGNTAIPDTEMREWLEQTAASIRALRPRRVLEIGCGVGLLVRALAPECSVYRGSDFSGVALDRLRAFVEQEPELRHVELIQRDAAGFADEPAASVDTVILNSVAQYFPDLEYLKAVLEQAARVVEPGGKIFVGDLRNFALQPVFHASVQLSKARPEAKAAWLRRRTALAVDQEKELVVDPRFFLGLSRVIPRVRAAEILLKRSAASNELARYRYDVVLHVEGPGLPPADPVKAWRMDGATVTEQLHRFEASQLSAVRILDVPNRRLAADLAAFRLLDRADDQQSVAALRDALAGAVSSTAPTGFDPDEFWRLADSGTHAVRVSWSPHAADGSFDVVLVDRRRWPGPLPQPRPAAASEDHTVAHATNPLAVAGRQQLGVELSKLLRTRMPEAQLPAAVLAVSDRFPRPVRAET